MKKIIFIVLLLFLTNSTLQATGGSLYSRYGIGDLYYSNSAMHLSLGGLGVSLLNNKYINTSNPATLFSIRNTRFGANVSSTTFQLDDGIENAVYTRVKFTGFHITFPVKESLGMGFILGMTPYSDVNYDVINSTGIADDVIEEQFEGTGGISKVFFGLSYLLPFDIAVGATFDYYTGNVQYKSSYQYSESSELLDSYFVNDYKYKGLGATLGFESPDLAKVFQLEGITNFRIGASYEISGPMNTDTAIVVRTSIGENTYESDQFDTKIPTKLVLGLNLT